jgi:hypothetical protein
VYLHSLWEFNLVRVPYLPSNLKGAGHLVVKFTAWSLGLLVFCRDVDLVTYSKVNWSSVSINVGFLLCLGLCYKLPS